MSGRLCSMVGFYRRGTGLTEDKLIQFLSSLRRLFREGPTEAIVDYFELPLVLYTVVGVTVIRDEADLMRIVGEYRAAMELLKVDHSSFEIQHRDPTNNRRLRATVRYTDYQADGRAVTGSLVRYFIVERNGSWKLEMIEYLEAPLPALEVERIVH